MQSIALGQTGRSTIRLGFGCSGGKGSPGRKEFDQAGLRAGRGSAA